MAVPTAVSPPFLCFGGISYPFHHVFHPFQKHHLNTQLIHLQWRLNPRFVRTRSRNGTSFRVCCRASAGDGETQEWWKQWIAKREKAGFGFGPDKVLRSIAGATSSPICQFIPSPSTFLHSVDPRIKLVWLFALVFLPARSHIYMRFGVVLSLALLSTSMLPKNVWMDQLGRVTLLSVILFIMLGLSADGALPSVPWRTPPSSLTGFPCIPSSLKGYTYMIFELGPLRLTRKGLSVASTSACLTFTLIYHWNLYCSEK